MADEQRVRLDLHRTFIDTIPDGDDAAARAWVLDHVLARVVVGGKLRGMLIFLHRGSVEQADVPEVELGAEAVLARAFLELRGRPGVLHGFRFGEVIVRTDEGARRAAAVVGFDPARTDDGDVGVGRWWRALRIFGQRADGSGTAHGDWEIAEGQGLDALDEPLREWLDAENLGLGAMRFEPSGPPPGRGIEMSALQLESALPADVAACMPVLLRVIGDGMLRGLPTPVVVVVVKGTDLFTYALRDDPPVPLEDLIRALAHRHDAELAGIILPTVLAIEGDHVRGAALAIERGGARAQAAGRRLAPGVTVRQAEFHLVPVGPFGKRPWLGQGPVPGLALEPAPGPRTATPGIQSDPGSGDEC